MSSNKFTSSTHHQDTNEYSQGNKGRKGSSEQTPSPKPLQINQSDPRLLTPEGILQLQRMIGNQAVMRLIANHNESMSSVEVSAATAFSDQKQIQRQEGTLIQSSKQLKEGTKVKVLRVAFPKFQVEEIATGKKYWIEGAVKDYFKEDSGEKGSTQNNEPVAVVTVVHPPPVEKVTEEISQQPELAKVATPSQTRPSPVKAAVSPGKKKTQGPSLNERLKAAQYPTMGRVQDPTWEIIEPVLDSYGTFTPEEKKKLKDKLENSPIAPRGITELIQMTFRTTNKALFSQTIEKVKNDLSAATPELETWRAGGNTTTRGARGDTREPHEIQETGGLFGWNEGIVTLSHAKSIIKSVMQMTVEEQDTWISKWKWPTPAPTEKNPWVATGIGKEGGQKGGGEYIYELPLIFHEANGNPMVIATDTGDVDTATVIGVRLTEKGEEVVMLTGIPWKYITFWSGSINMQPPAMHKVKEAAVKTKALAKK